MAVDIFEKLKQNRGPLGQLRQAGHGYFFFPRLEGDIAPRMQFRGKEVLTWSINNYLGLANHPEVREVDAQAAKDWGLGYPMGSRMMSGETKYHRQLEEELSAFVQKEDSILLNFGYQGMASCVDALVDRNDVIVYDAECHACIIDGVRMHQGKRFVFPHNNMENLDKQLERATKLVEKTGGGILVITEGVYGMAGDQGDLKGIVALKKKYNFRLLVDDAHGIGTLGETGAGAGEEQGVQDEIDVYFGTFAKSFATIGAFVSSNEDVIDYFRYNMRSQIYAKSLPMPLVIGALKRLEIMRRDTKQKDQLWEVANALQKGLRDAGFNLGRTQSAVTPVFFSGGLAEAVNLTFDLRENYNLFCSLVVYPVIPKGEIMLRLIPTASHTIEDVNETVEAFKSITAKLKAGEYQQEMVNLGTV